jgi:hypothetical protein
MDFPMVFYCFECVSSMFLKLKFTNHVLSKTTFISFICHRIVSCVHGPHRGWREAGNVAASMKIYQNNLQRKEPRVKYGRK